MNGTHIRITSRPIGEAPEWVRDAWIGTILPLKDARKRKWFGVGVLTGPHTFWAQLWAGFRGRALRIDGYLVEASRAVAILSDSNPDAAEWWRINAHDLLGNSNGFIFDAPCCELTIT